MTNNEMTNDEKNLMSKLMELGGRAGNISLRNQLGWDDKKYWDIRKKLISHGNLAVGGGKGGSVRIPDESKDDVTSSLAAPEKSLYEPIKEVLEKALSEKWLLTDRVVEIVAHGGSKDTGGLWTRPDLVLVSYTYYDHLPQRVFEVITFEVKPWQSLNVTGVYEALAHRRTATRAYLLAHVPDDRQESMKDRLNRIENAAAQYGVGFILAGDPGNHGTWDERVEAVRHDPPPQNLDQFLSQQLSDTAKKTLRSWGRS